MTAPPLVNFAMLGRALLGLIVKTLVCRIRYTLGGRSPWYQTKASHSCSSRR